MRIKKLHFGQKILHFQSKNPTFLVKNNIIFLDTYILELFLEIFYKNYWKNCHKIEKENFFFKIFNIFQKFAHFWHEIETRQKPETRQCKTRTRLSKLAKTRPEPDPDCPKPEPARPRLFQTRSITNPNQVSINFEKYLIYTKHLKKSII